MMEDDDIEYDITFPSPVAGENSVESIERKEPVVIILGWLGCREKYLAKYGQIYDERGCITIRYILPKDVVFFNPEKLDDVARKILDLLKDYSIEENPVMFHIFSNNGSHLYADIVKVLTSGDERYQNLNICGVVVDSAPGKARIRNGARAYLSTVKVNPVLKFLMMVVMMAYLLIYGTFSYIMSTLFPKYKRNNKYFLYETMVEDPTHWPMLFLYSKSDNMIMYYDVEEFIERRKKLGVHVDSVCWEDSDHVSHLRKHPEEYIEACERFLQFCTGIEFAEFLEEELVETEEDYLASKNE